MNINGFSAELLFQNLVKNTPKLKPFKLPTSRELLNLAISSKIGRRRLEKAKPYLIREFGFYYRLQDKLVLSFDWEQVPSQVILDYVFGIDVIFSYLGYTIAVDVTVNPQTISSKINKLNHLKPLWKELEIDKACVCLVTNNESNPTKIWNIFKSVVKEDLVTQIAI